MIPLEPVIIATATGIFIKITEYVIKFPTMPIYNPLIELLEFTVFTLYKIAMLAAGAA